MSGRAAWTYLALAAVALPFANGRWSVAIVAWVAPLFLVLFLDSQPVWRGFAVAFPVQILAFVINWWEMIPVPRVLYYLITATYALVYFLPFCLHRWISPRIAGFSSTLVLPCAWVGIEFLVQRFATPYGSWGSIAYTQVDQLGLLQLASVTGMAGISFLMLWFASAGAWIVRRERPFRLRLRGGLIYVAVLVVVIVGGGVRLARAQLAPDLVRVAGITPSASLNRELQEAFGKLRTTASENATLQRDFEESARRLNDDLLRRTRAAARGGARIVVWSEHAGRLTKTQEGPWIQDAAALAREEGIVLFMGLGVWNPGAVPPFENKLIVIDHTGAVVRRYSKAKPIVGSEASLIAAGDAGVAVLDTEHGRLGAVICHDLDFPDFIREAGRKRVDILFGPSSDWDEITPFHGRMAVVRAVENGLTLFRPCANGLTIAVDPYGRPLAKLIDRGDDGNVLAIPIPRSHVETIYPVAGDGFSVLGLGGLLTLALVAMRRRGGTPQPKLR